MSFTGLVVRVKQVSFCVLSRNIGYLAARKLKKQKNQPIF